MNSPIKNLIINSIGVLSTSAISFLIVPAYTRVFGIEIYAIFATWIFITTLMQFLDFGYSTTIIKFADHKSDMKTFGEKVISFEFIIVLSIVVLIAISVFFTFPNVGIYSVFNEELGRYSLVLFLSPILLGNIIKYYSFSFLARGEFKIYNLSIVSTEIIKQVGGFFIFNETSSWLVFFYYQIFVSVVIYLSLKFYFKSKFKCELFPSWGLLKKNFHISLNFTKIILFSAIIGSLMSTFDRLILSINFTEREIACYSACFIVAGIINMAIQPFHRLSLPLFINFYDKGRSNELGNVMSSLSSLLSSLTLSLGGLMVLYADNYMPLLLSGEYNSSMLQIIGVLSVSFWFVACGWLPANLLQAAGMPNIQMKNMIYALMFGGLGSLIFAANNFLIGVTAIWLVHGFIQVFITPFLSSNKTGFFNFKHWFIDVVIVKLAIILPIFAIAFFIKFYVGALYSVAFYMTLSTVFVCHNLIGFKDVYSKI